MIRFGYATMAKWHAELFWSQQGNNAGKWGAINHKPTHLCISPRWGVLHCAARQQIPFEADYRFSTPFTISPYLSIWPFSGTRKPPSRVWPSHLTKGKLITDLWKADWFFSPLYMPSLLLTSPCFDVKGSGTRAFSSLICLTGWHVTRAGNDNNEAHGKMRKINFRLEFD